MASIYQYHYIEERPGFNYEVQLWIRTKDLDVLYWNPVIEGPDSKSELVWATIECTYVLPDVRVPSIPFWPRNMNSMIWKSLTVFVSSGGPQFIAQELGS